MMTARIEEWENSGDYDTQTLSGEEFKTVTVNDGNGDPVAIVYGRTLEECRDRAEEIAGLRKPTVSPVQPKASAYSCGEHEDHTSYESASRCILARPR